MRALQKCKAKANTLSGRRTEARENRGEIENAGEILEMEPMSEISMMEPRKRMMTAEVQSQNGSPGLSTSEAGRVGGGYWFEDKGTIWTVIMRVAQFFPRSSPSYFLNLSDNNGCIIVRILSSIFRCWSPFVCSPESSCSHAR